MEISRSEKQAYYFVPQLSPKIVGDRIEKKKTTLVAGMSGILMPRPSPAQDRNETGQDSDGPQELRRKKSRSLVPSRNRTIIAASLFCG